jgi:alpha 1,2-mannosyltransferase
MSVLSNLSDKLWGTPDRAKSPPYDTKREKLPSSSASTFSYTSNSSSSSNSDPPMLNPLWNARQKGERGPPMRAITRFLPTSWRTNKRQFAVLICFALAAFIWFVPQPQHWGQKVNYTSASRYQIIKPESHVPAGRRAPNPQRWLEENGNNRHAVQDTSFLKSLVVRRPKAALISLVRNSELDGLVQSMQQLEFHWNRKYQYDWIFFNDEPFTDEFKVRLEIIDFRHFWLTCLSV